MTHSNCFSLATMGSEFDGLLHQLRSVDQSSVFNDDIRAQILEAAQGLCRRLETPFDWMKRIISHEPNLNLCLNIANDTQLFKHLGKRNSRVKTSVELAHSTNINHALLDRILRHLAAQGVIIEVGEDSYQATDVSEVLASPEGSSGIHCLKKLTTPVYQYTPEFLKSTNYQVLPDPRNGPLQETIGKPGQTHWEFLNDPAHEDCGTAFNMLMRFMGLYEKSWVDVFQPDEPLEDARDPEAPLLVDVGGSIGTKSVSFRRKYPHLRGKVIFQDLPAVVASASEKNSDLASLGIEGHPYDFFTPQPITHARIYFLGSILHDWPDDDARKILRNLVPALEKRYSKVLLSENVIPRTGCHANLSALDLGMTFLNGSHERTEQRWTQLLNEEGLVLKKIHMHPSCTKSVMEAELA